MGVCVGRTCLQPALDAHKFVFGVFMTDIALIPAQTVAILFLVCRIWDAVNDPMIGSMADRTKSKMGRYRPWMLGGAVCLMPIVVLLLRRTRLGV